jgi:flagellar motor switch protein FliN
MEKIRITAVEKAVANSIIETFDTMLGLNLTKVGKITDESLDDKRLVGSVNYAGEVVGIMSIHVSEAFANMIASTMLGIEEGEIESIEEVKDVLGEITNIVSGNLKSDFLDSDLACVISTPSITRGSDFKIEPSRMGDLFQWIFRCKSGQVSHELIIEISLKEDVGARAEIDRMSSYSVEEYREKIKSVDVPTCVINTVIDVFYTMLSMEVENIAKVPDEFREEKRTVGMVSFAGDVQGVFIIQVNDDFARTMTAAMLGMEEDEIESKEEVYDVIRELSNIIGGNLKSGFVDVGLQCVLSTPSITNGLDFRVESLNIIKTQRFLFKYNGATIIVDAGIKSDDYGDGADSAEPGGEEKDAAAAGGEHEGRETENELRNLALILGIPLEIRVELGRSEKSIREVLKLGKGSVVDLVQLEGEPLDLYINETLIAKGEAVVEKEKYGIRIIEVVSRMERLKSFT